MDDLHGLSRSCSSQLVFTAPCHSLVHFKITTVNHRTKINQIKAKAPSGTLLTFDDTVQSQQSYGLTRIINYLIYLNLWYSPGFFSTSPTDVSLYFFKISFMITKSKTNYYSPELIRNTSRIDAGDHQTTLEVQYKIASYFFTENMHN